MDEGALIATCHCGRASIRLSRAPDHVVQCNCSLCQKTGFKGIYYSSAELVVEGEFDSYVRADSNPPALRLHRCVHCGVATHWTPLSDPPHQRMGVNARLLDPEILAEVPVREADGRSWAP